LICCLLGTSYIRAPCLHCSVGGKARNGQVKTRLADAAANCYLPAVSYKGKVKNGVVILPRDAKLPNGTEVQVTPVIPEQAVDFTNMLVSLSKKVRGLPRDLAAQHDHYLYGNPKR
jgi:hypothetical protein